MSLVNIGAIWRRDQTALDRRAVIRFAQALGADAGDFEPGRPIPNWALLSSASIGSGAGSETTPTVVADTHLHNRPALCRDLRLTANDSPLPESTLLTAAYQAWGGDLTQRLVGDFAMCIFDQRHPTLIVARDRLGCKPLYYAEHAGHIVVCSLIQPILDSGLIPNEVYPPRLADHIVLRSESAEPERTFFTHIRRVPPAHSIRFTLQETHLTRYWTLTPPAPLTLACITDYADAFRSELAAAIARSAQDAGHLAAMLSGGMDSSAICALHQAAPGSRQPLTTLAAINHPQYIEQCIESRSSAQVASHIASRHATVDPEQFASWIGDLRDEFQRSTDMFDSLMMTTSLAVMKLAEHRQVTVLLDGLDGGMVAGFSGGDSLHALLAQKQYHQAYHELNRINLVHGTARAQALWNRYMKGQLKRGLPKLITDWIETNNHRRYYQAMLDSSAINSEFAHSVDLAARLLEVESGLIGDYRLTHAEQHAQRLQHPSLMMAIERYERIARHHGIEARHPLLDVRFIEFCLSLPAEMKQRGRQTKPLMRKALKPLLPANVVRRPYRPQDHLAMNFSRAWLAANADLADQAWALRPDLGDYFDKRRIMKMDDSKPYLTWSLLSFVLWYR